MLAATLKATLPAPLFGALRAIAWRVHLMIDWWGTRVWTRTREVVTPLGFRLTSGLHPAYAQMRAGTFEPDETAILSQLLDEADVFVDVGANLGYYTLLALHRGKRAISFEPQPQNLRALYQNLESNGWQDRAEVFPLALADRPGLLALYGASGPSASLVKGWADYSPRHKQTVPISTLDAILSSRPLGDRLLIKIDVEGAELGVLRGAPTVLDRTPKPAWLVEICLNEFHPMGSNPDFEKIFDLFFDRGYAAYTATQPPVPVTRSDVRRWVAQGRSDGAGFNYVFTPLDRPLGGLLAKQAP